MDARFPAIAEQLLLIERELRVQGWWDEVSPSAEALSSVELFSVVALVFHEGLEGFFLARMKQILEQDLPLPNASGILEMAEMVYADRPRESLGLRNALKKFDQLIVDAR